MSRLARRLFGIAAAEVRVERRGFRVGDPGVRARLETIGETFVAGYHAGLIESRPAPLARRLSEIDVELRGFAFEGAAMALALKDAFTPWRRPAWRTFLDETGEPHAYMLHVGAGWALARVGAPVHRVIAAMDPLLRWLAFDGFGFHQGYFQPRRTLEAREVPGSLKGYERRAFDQGVGRSLWFAQGADPEGIADAIAGFPRARHQDLWSGVGLACAYAGGADRAGIEALAARANGHAPGLAQGAAFAAKARARAGNPAPHTRIACEVLCGASDEEAAQVTDEALASLASEPGRVPAVEPGAGEAPAYDAWRREIRDRLAEPRPAGSVACPAR